MTGSLALLLSACGNRFTTQNFDEDAGLDATTAADSGAPETLIDPVRDSGVQIGMDGDMEGGIIPSHDSGPDAARDAGRVLDSGTDARMADGGVVDADIGGSPPILLHPEPGVTLPPTRAFILLEDGVVPQGLAVAGYQFCYTTQGLPFINNDSLCPNPNQITDNHTVIDSLLAGATYYSKDSTIYTNSSISSYGPVVQFNTDNSLLAWWKNDTGSGDVSNDSSGNNHDGALNNFNTATSWVPGIVGSALRFDGVKTFVSVATEDAFDFGTNSFTLAAWINPQDTGTFQALIEKRSTSPSSNFFELYRRPNGMLAIASAACGQIAAGGNLTAGVWHYVAATREADQFNLYINGVLEASGNCVDDFNNTSPLTFGCNSPEVTCVEPYAGDMDEGSVFTRALSLAEIKYHGYCAALEQGGQTLPASCLQ